MVQYSAHKEAKGGFVERRKYPRYRFNGDELLVFRHSDKKVGWITDMRMGEFSNEYIPTSESKSEKEIIDIFAHGNKRLFLPKFDINAKSIRAGR